ncbi:MAG: hypothetical protein ACRDFW_07655 [bacterium]
MITNPGDRRTSGKFPSPENILNRADITALFVGIPQDLTRFIPKIDALVSSYALGIEIDEYWTVSKAKAIGDHLQTLTFKKVAGHQEPGKWNYCKGNFWCDYMILQYGSGKSETAIKSMTQAASTDLGRPVVAGEYNGTSPESQSVNLGNAAVSVGAVGFGNGGGTGLLK